MVKGSAMSSCIRVLFLNEVYVRMNIYIVEMIKRHEFDHDGRSRDGRCFRCLPPLEWLRPYAPRPRCVFAV